MKNLCLLCIAGLFAALVGNSARVQAAVPDPSHFSEVPAGVGPGSTSAPATNPFPKPVAPPVVSPAPKPGSNLAPKPQTNAALVTLTNRLSQELLRPSARPFTLGPGDSVELEILGNAASRAVATVGPDGKIYFNLLPGMDVWGLTLAEVRDQLEKGLSKYLPTPQVSVTLRTVGSKYVWVLGRLNRPGIFPLSGPMTLLESLAQAGGTSRSSSQVTTEELADLRHSFVVRQGQFLPVDFQRLLHQGDASQNIYLEPDDFVYVPSALAQEVYVLGAVKAPRAVGFVEDMTVVSALAGANGADRYAIINSPDSGPFTKDAYVSHVAVVRGSLAEPKIAIVDYQAVIKGHASDYRLEPGDIIYVPNSPYTTLKRYFNLIANTFVSTVAANEGVNAAGGNAGVGVSVSVGK
jgi:protein involved in polysaccharide export with SLBB domain